MGQPYKTIIQALNYFKYHCNYEIVFTKQILHRLLSLSLTFHQKQVL